MISLSATYFKIQKAIHYSEMSLKKQDEIRREGENNVSIIKIVCYSNNSL